MHITKRKVVKPEEAKLVAKLAKRCLRELSKKKWEIGDVNDLSELIVNCSFKGSYGCARYISIDVSAYRSGATFFGEYFAIADDPTIGRRAFEDREGGLAALVAHEIAHHIQYKYGPSTRWLRKKYRKPHGEGWQAIYRILRREFVNKEYPGEYTPRVKREPVPIEPRVEQELELEFI